MKRTTASRVSRNTSADSALFVQFALCELQKSHFLFPFIGEDGVILAVLVVGDAEIPASSSSSE